LVDLEPSIVAIKIKLSLVCLPLLPCNICCYYVCFRQACVNA
jgi:hypothetical protein